MTNDKKNLAKIPIELHEDIPTEEWASFILPEISVANNLKSRRLDAHGQMIGRITSSPFFVSHDTSIGDLALELHKDQKIQCVGIVDQSEKAVGLIERKILFDLLGRPHCRDVYSKKSVDKIMGQSKIFRYNENIFSVAENLEDVLNDQTQHHFLLTDGDGQFAGCFSSTDLLIYLSSITKKDINLARKLQMSIFRPENHIKAEKLVFVGKTEMAKGVGGDFYHIQKYGTHNWHLALGDVSGKGISASLVAAILGGMFRINDFRQGLKKLIRNINDYIMQSFEMEKFITAIFMDIDEQTGKVKIADMGHSLLYLCRKGKVMQIKTGDENLPLGVLPDIEPILKSFQLEDEDLVLLITDGITDQMNQKGEAFSGHRLIEILKQHYKEDLSKLKDIISESVKTFQGQAIQNDDMTFVFFRYHKK